MRTDNKLSPILGAFFLSGFSALIYELTWLKQIQLIMGHSVYSLGTTLCAYLGGLAAGAFFARKILSRLRGGESKSKAIFFYVLCESFVGIYGLLFPFLLRAGAVPYQWFLSQHDWPLFVVMPLQFLWCASLVFIPTFLMGTTLPVLISVLGLRRLSAVYGINALGGALGVLFAGLFILPAVGQNKTLLLAAIINFAAVFLLSFAKDLPLPDQQLVTDEVKEVAPPLLRELLQRYAFSFSLLFLGGFCAMSAQIIWNRMAAMVYGPSVYIFPLVAFCILLGIAVGSFVVDRLRKTETYLYFAPALIATLFAASTYGLGKMPLWVLQFHASFPSAGFAEYTAFEFFSLLLVLLPACTGLGALYPLAFCAMAPKESDHPLHGTTLVGIGSVLNLLGVILGVLVGGFVLMPWLGLERLARLNFMLMFLLSTAGCTKSFQFSDFFSRFQNLRIIFLPLVFGFYVFLPPLNWDLLTGGYFYNRLLKFSDTQLKEYGFLHITDLASIPTQVLVARQDDPHATISIHSDPFNPHDLAFKINGKVDGNNTSDLRTTRLVALLPALVRTDYESVLTVGLGVGSSAAETLRYPDIRKSHVVELSSAMIDFARRFFPDVNGQLWGHPRFQVIHRDGRDYLQNTNHLYDLIISEPSNPWVDGVASLFTTQYYQAVSDHLTQSGVASLWFHSYGLDCTSIQSVMAAVTQVFPAVRLFAVEGDFYILAAKRAEALKFQMPADSLALMREDLLRIGAGLEVRGTVSADTYGKFLQKTFIAGGEDLLRQTSQMTANTDDNELLQFQSGKTFFQKISCSLYGIRDTRARKEQIEKIMGELSESPSNSKIQERGLASEKK